jgi:hypothetical protein
MSNIKILLFRHHANDPISRIIGAHTRSAESHAAFLVDPATNTIIEAYVPTVRKRQLSNSELAGIDVYDIPGLSPAQEAALLEYLEAAVKAHEPYSIADLFKFYALPRAILGDQQPSPSLTAPTFCSMLVMRGMNYGARYPILNAPEQDVDPGHVKWTPLISLAAPLKPLPELEQQPIAA